MPRPPPPPGPPRSRSCSGPPAAPPGSARQAPPARRRRGGGVDAVAYAFARERVQEGPGGRHLAVVPRGARGVAQAGHGAGGALGAAAVSAKTGRAAPPGLCFSHPSDPAAPSPPPERRPLTFGNPSRSPEPVDRQTADTRLRRAGAGKSAPLRPPPKAASPPSAQPFGRAQIGAGVRTGGRASPRFRCWILPQRSRSPSSPEKQRLLQYPPSTQRRTG